MVFKKNDKFTKEMSRKGGKIGGKKTQKLYPKMYLENLKDGGWKCINSNKEHQSASGKQCRVGENNKAKELESQYDDMFLPQSVCDRICFKDGKLIFIEIKQNKEQKLKPKQQEFKELCEKYNYKYIVEYIK